MSTVTSCNRDYSWSWRTGTLEVTETKFGEMAGGTFRSISIYPVFCLWGWVRLIRSYINP